MTDGPSATTNDRAGTGSAPSATVGSAIGGLLMDSFDDIHRAELRYYKTEPRNPELLEEVQRRRQAFVKRHGRLLHYCYFPKAEASVGLTEDGRLHVVDSPIASLDEFEALVLEAKGLHRSAVNLLEPRDVIKCAEPIHGVICGLFNALESARTAGLVDNAERVFLQSSIQLHRMEFKQAEKLFAQCNNRQAQLAYFQGTMTALVPLLLVAWAAWDCPSIGDRFVSKQVFVAWCLGGIGAAISVLHRMANGRLLLDPTASAPTLRILGAIRPFIGAVFSVIAFAIIMGGWSPITLASKMPEMAYQVVVAGFVGGFSERWAQDMLTNVGQNKLSVPEVEAQGMSRGSDQKSDGGRVAAPLSSDP